MKVFEEFHKFNNAEFLANKQRRYTISAFIEHNNVEWLIVLCVSFVLMGIAIIVYPYMKEKIIMRQPSFEHYLKKSSRKLF